MFLQKPHGVTAQKTALFIATVVKTLNLFLPSGSINEVKQCFYSGLLPGLHTETRQHGYCIGVGYSDA
jgi:hypothetical protein